MVVVVPPAPPDGEGDLALPVGVADDGCCCWRTSAVFVWQDESAVRGLDGECAADGDVVAVTGVAGMSMVNLTSPCSTLMLQHGDVEEW